MLKIASRYLLVLLAILLIGCAKRGNITGGFKDTLAPILRESVPKKYKTNFTGNEIKLYFDEYVKLKDVNKQLIVSPPMNTAPVITPTSASKYISIKIKDTLKPDTTYSLNFGQSIQDNNEGNVFPQFKYVFSTGSYIDSLSVSGTIQDALEAKSDNFVTVMLYEINEKYNDSTVYKEKPRYVTNTLDSATTFKIENIKAGTYQLIALKDNNNNFIYNPGKDKIAFYKEPIVIGAENESYNLKLFQEVLNFKTFKPAQVSGNRATLGYTGDAEKMNITLKNGNEILKTVVTKLPQKDSVQIWFPVVKADSLQLLLDRGDYSKDYYFKIKEQKNDSLSFTPKPSGTIHFREHFELTSFIPLTKFDKTKMTLVNKDSVAVDFTTEYDEFNQKLKFNFTKEPEQKYKITLLPGALTDFYERSNDTLQYKLNTKGTSDYGNLTMKLENLKRFPVIVQLTDAKGKVIDSEYLESEPVARFNLIQPGTFIVRIIYDTNGNKKWDAGSYWDKMQSEEVIYFPDEIDVRANWDVDQPFILAP
ncbi:Ig-like domain-containing protein [Flavobacterium antarcticum]|uniref:Ig-like domain-containing protein n=1 Tax=Flavobacterium antarcticum TaxID=271155 RepID=UPI0003B3983C|nr:Ig-like domain-containing protein [Flavobacterium antarcticum]